MDTKKIKVNLKAVASVPIFTLKLEALRNNEVIARKISAPAESDLSIILREEDKHIRSALCAIYGDKRNYNKADSSWTCTPERTRLDKVKLAPNLTTLSYTFSGYDKVEKIDVSGWDTSKIVSMQSVFDSCKSIREIDLTSWDTSNCKSFSGLFSHCSNLEHIEGVIDMRSCVKEIAPPIVDFHYSNMFKGCDKLQGVKIKNPPETFMQTLSIFVEDATGSYTKKVYGYEYAGLRRDQFEIVE